MQPWFCTCWGPSPSSVPFTEQSRDWGPRAYPSLPAGMLLPQPSRPLPLCAGSAPAGQMAGEPGPQLSQLSVTDVTTSSMRLSWEAPPGAFDSFLLRYGVSSASTLEPHPRPLLQREVAVPGTRLSAVLRDLRPGTLYSLTLYGLRGPHQADSVQGTARTLSPGEPGEGSWCLGLRSTQPWPYLLSAGAQGGRGIPNRSPAPCPHPHYSAHLFLSSGEPPGTTVQRNWGDLSQGQLDTPTVQSRWLQSVLPAGGRR